MSTDWQYRVFVLCHEDSIVSAIQALDVAFPCDDLQARDPSKPELLSLPLSESGQSPPTHFGSSFSVTEQLRQTLEGMGLANTPGVLYWRMNANNGQLQTTNHQGSQSLIGQEINWNQILDLCNLKEIEPESGPR